MITKFSVGAALESEVDRYKEVSRCPSFRQLVILADNPKKFVQKKEEISFECRQYWIIPNYSTKNFKSFFKYEEGMDKRVTVSIPEGWCVGLCKSWNSSPDAKNTVL